MFTVRQDATLPSPAIGDTVTLQCAPEQMHWFDPASTRRLA
jgi:hypothetical protein